MRSRASTFLSSSPAATAGIVPITISSAVHAAGSGAGPASVPTRGIARIMARIGPEVDENGHERADVARHVERHAELLGVPAEEGPGQDEVGRARDRRNSVSP